MRYRNIVLALAAAGAAFASHAQVGPRGETGDPAQATQPTQPSQAPQRPRWATANPWSTSYNPLIGFQSSRTREQVRAELMTGREVVLSRERTPRGG